MQKYFVAYLLTGGAKTYHEGLTRALSKRYRIFPLHEKVVPHITVKPPFEADEEGIAEVERVLRSFAHGVTATPLSFSGFGRFGFKTAYIDTKGSPQAVELVRSLIKTLNDNISWLPRFPLEGNKLHASIARFMDRVQSRRVARYLAHEKARFEASLDNIAILRKEGQAWKVMSVIPFQKDDAWVLPRALIKRKEAVS